MRLFLAAPQNLLNTSHIEAALEQANISVAEVLLCSNQPGSTQTWLREWAKKNEVEVREYDETSQVLKLMAKSKDAAVVAVVSPDHPETLDLVSKAESLRIPVYIYRELYRRDPRVNCRFSPVERPDVWLKALTAEQRDFFRRLHSLCHQYGVQLNTPTGDGGSFMTFTDGTEFEGVELDFENCRVRPRLLSISENPARLDPLEEFAVNLSKQNRLSSVDDIEWVVYAKRPFGGPKQVVNYLGRYTHRVAISNHRLVNEKDGKVKFRWKDYRRAKSENESGTSTMELDAHEFIRRLFTGRSATSCRHCQHGQLLIQNP